MTDTALPILSEAPIQLHSWIDEIDVQIADLTLKRIAFTRALETFQPHDPSVLVDAADTGQPPAALVAAAAAVDDLETRREADRKRKKNQRARTRTKTPAKRAANPRGTSKYDYAEVARIANAAVRANLSAARAVAQKYNVGNAMGAYLIKEARRRGHEIESRIAKPKPTTTPPPAHKTPPITASNHPAGRAPFTPADTLKLIEGGASDG